MGGKNVDDRIRTVRVIEPIIRCRATEFDWHGKRTRVPYHLNQLCETDVWGIPAH